MVIRTMDPKVQKAITVVDCSYPKLYKRPMVVLIGVVVSFLHDQPRSVVLVCSLLG